MGYSAAPWTFKGRALYQLQLVRAEEARKYIPEELPLVECFGWTLGGVYLARYDDSPVGKFDECVVMAGLVWNAPTSCAWAGRVYVSNKEARDHGLSHVGLPSRLAAFRGSAAPLEAAGSAKRRAAKAASSWWRRGDAAGQQGSNSNASTSSSSSGGAASHSIWARLGELGGRFTDAVELRNEERGRRGLAAPVATFMLPPARAEGFMGPRMRLSLPSFSGGTAAQPALLQYSCDLQTNVMPVTPMTVELHNAVTGSASGDAKRREEREEGRGGGQQRWWPWGRREQREARREGGEALDALLGGRPLLCLAFNDMVMKVEEPVKLPTAEAAPARARGGGAALLATVPPRL